MNKKILSALIAVGTIASAYYIFTTNVSAVSSVNGLPLVNRIAQKFNLKESDVQAVFDAVRDERRAEMKKERDSQLTRAVADGLITEDQKKAILDMMQNNSAARFAHREEMQKWFSDHGIDETKLHQYLKPIGMGRGMHMPI